MITELSSRSLIKVTGADSMAFLQSQFSNDLNRLKRHQAQITLYCQYQGKVIAVIWLFKDSQNFYLSIPEELVEIVLSKLETYKLMSQVNFEDISQEFFLYGLIDEKNKDSFWLINNLHILISQERIGVTTSIDNWESACVKNMLAEIYKSNTETLTPQALNFDINELGVSFSKGCYPGQEVVARMHYLGKPKRRLFHFTSDYEASVGDSIDVQGSNSLKSPGEIVRVAKIDDKYHYLGTFQIRHVDDQMFLKNDIKKPLTISNG